MTTWYFRLALGEIWTTKHEELTWSGIAIGKQSTPLASTWRSTYQRRSMRLLFVERHTISTQSSVRFDHTPWSSQCSVWPWRDILHAPGPAKGRANVTDQDSWSRIGVRWAIDKQHTTTSEGTYSGPISRAWLARMGQHNIFVPDRYVYSIQNTNVSSQATMTTS
jgi:hypothetical protein